MNPVWGTGRKILCFDRFKAGSCFALSSMIASSYPYSFPGAALASCAAPLTQIPTQFRLNNPGRWSLSLLILCPHFPNHTPLRLRLMSKICCSLSLKREFCSASNFTNAKYYHQTPKCIVCTRLLWVFLINDKIL